MITKLAEELLEKVAVTKWKAMQAGLSVAGKRRLDPLRKSIADEIAGINLGTQRIKAKKGIITSDMKTLREKLIAAGYDGGATMPKGVLDGPLFFGSPAPVILKANPDSVFVRALSSMHKVFDGGASAGARAARDAALHRHEALEGVRAKAQKWKPTGIFAKKDKLMSFIDRLRGHTPETPRVVPVGKHMSPGVLADEARLINQSSHPELFDTLVTARSRSGEAGLLARAAGVENLYAAPMDTRHYRAMKRMTGNVNASLRTGPMSSNERVFMVD